MWSDEDASNHLEKVIEIAKQINSNELTILTGSNGTGKSLIRKILPNHIGRQLNIEPNKAIGSISMERRTIPNYDLGALSTQLIDKADDPTSLNTWILLDNILKQIDTRYIIIDEPEIGTSEELLLSFMEKITSEINKSIESGKFKGCLVITHSKFFVKNTKCDKFLNLDGLTKEEWLNRIPIMKPIEELEHNSYKLYLAVERKVKENKDN